MGSFPKPRPVALDDYGLVAALRIYAAEFSKRFGTGVSVSGDDPALRLPLPAETALFRIAQEALNNVAKHARATRATVHAGVQDGTLRIRVQDDGTGGARADGHGLVGLADRLAVLGGRLVVENPVGGGTLVAADIPLPGQAPG